MSRAQAEGLPLASVPPADIIERLDSAGSAHDREALLLIKRPDILPACNSALGECTATEHHDNHSLIHLAVSALQSGNDAAGMTLAVSVGEGLAHWAVHPRVLLFDSRQKLAKWIWSETTSAVVNTSVSTWSNNEDSTWSRVTSSTRY
jgi:hypothetical protein